MSAHYLKRLDYAALRNCESAARVREARLGSSLKRQREEPAAPRLWLLLRGWGQGLRPGHREADGPVGGFPSKTALWRWESAGAPWAAYRAPSQTSFVKPFCPASFL